MANSSPAFPRPTVATSSRHESFELADYPAEHPLLPDPDSADTRAGSSGNVARLFQPFANSQSLAGVDSESEEDWEKAGSSEEHRPRGFRSTRLRFWADALRNLAQTANRTPVDPETAAKMKFSHSIQFNAVPDWSTNYIAYSNLKKLYVVRSLCLLDLEGDLCVFGVLSRSPVVVEPMGLSTDAHRRECHLAQSWVDA